MTTINAKQVKELRERTGSGMMECKKALLEAEGDMDKAIELMRKSGQAKAAKKSGRSAAEGVVAIKVADDGKFAFMVEVNSETDFAAKDSNFRNFVDQVVVRGFNKKVDNITQLLTAAYKDNSDQTVADACKELVVKIGENIQVRRVCAIGSDSLIGSYCHGGRIGVLVNLSVGDSVVAKDIAMHIAASNPEVISPEDISDEIVAREKDIFMAQAAQSGKPQNIIEKMVDGKINKFVNEVSLVGQPFIKDPSITVGELLKNANAQVLTFVRYEVGEGVEKDTADFAAEVKAQLEGSN